MAGDQPAPAIRPMRPGDLGAVEPITEAAFAGVLETLFGVRPNRVFAPELFPFRLARDPAGCFVAEVDGRIAGALFSVAWGSVGWFGPLAVDPSRQDRSIGQALVAACIDEWARRGVRIGGLETFPQSPKHLHIYAKFGFAPLGLSLAIEKPAAPDRTRPGAIARWSELTDAERAEVRIAVDRCADRILPGLRVSGELTAAPDQVETLIARRDGTAIGCAVVQIRPHLRPGRSAVDVTLAVVDPLAGGLADLIDLLGAAESLAAETGRRTIATRVHGAHVAAYQALAGIGYRITGSSVRMLSGPVDFRPDRLLLDNWL